MNPLFLLGLVKRWWRAILVVAFLAAMLGWHVHETRKAHQLGRAAVQRDWDAAKAKQERDVAQERTRQAQARLDAAKENQRDLDRNSAAVRAADASAERLRSTIAALLRDRQAPTAVAGSASAPTAADLLADVQRRIDEAAGLLGQVADDRLAAGLQCEREYNATQ